MQFGVNSFVWTSPFTTRDFGLMPKIKSMGFDIIEIAVEDASLIDVPLLRQTAQDDQTPAGLGQGCDPQRRLLKQRPIARQGDELLGPCRPRGGPQPRARSTAHYDRIDRHSIYDGMTPRLAELCSV